METSNKVEASARPTVHLDGPCPVCCSNATFAVAEFPLDAPYVGQWSTLYHCIACGSAHFRHEPADSSSVNWHKKIISRNLEWSSHLEQAILSQYTFSSVIDIGCGVGTWISHLASKGHRVLGFEPGKEAAAFGRSYLGVDIRTDYFVADVARERYGAYDLVTCIMVLEHLRRPRLLIKEIADYCVATGSKAFISVPFYYSPGHLELDAESKPSALFNSVSAHVTYFSVAGMKLAFSAYGLGGSSSRKITPESNSWSGFLFWHE